MRENSLLALIQIFVLVLEIIIQGSISVCLGLSFFLKSFFLNLGMYITNKGFMRLNFED